MSIALLLWACIGFAAVPCIAQQPTPRRLVLLGARWCAPCVAEYRNLPNIVNAAAPDQVVLAWVDRPMPVPPQLASRVQTMTPVEARALALRLGGEGFGLPMATIIEGARPPCPPWRGHLHEWDIFALRSLCHLLPVGLAH
jgi:thiol-disulfide isomerase/thioredoxin